jgi:hypothetical protein
MYRRGQMTARTSDEMELAEVSYIQKRIKRVSLID